MSIELEAQKLNACLDGELDLMSQLEIEQRIQAEPALRAQVHALRQLREALRGGADYHLAPAALRERVAALSVATPAAGSLRRTDGDGAGAWRRWTAWRPLLAGCGVVAAVAALAIPLVPGWRGRDERLQQEVIASHVRSMLGEHLLDVVSSDHHTVKPWLSSKLDFSPPVPTRAIAGAEFAGGRVDYLGGRPVAALVYRHGAHVVNAYVWPNHAADSATTTSTERGYQIAHWTQAGMAYWVISDVNRDEFAALVRGIAQAGVDP